MDDNRTPKPERLSDVNAIPVKYLAPEDPPAAAASSAHVGGTLPYLILDDGSDDLEEPYSVGLAVTEPDSFPEITLYPATSASNHSVSGVALGSCVSGSVILSRTSRLPEAGRMSSSVNGC